MEVKTYSCIEILNFTNASAQSANRQSHSGLNRKRY